MPHPDGRGYGKGFHRLRRLVNFPLKGEVSNHKGIFDELFPPGTARISDQGTPHAEKHILKKTEREREASHVPSCGYGSLQILTLRCGFAALLTMTLAGRSSRSLSL